MGRAIWPFSLFICLANILTWGFPLAIVSYIAKFYTEQVKDITAGPNVILGLFILTFTLFITLSFMSFSVQHVGMFIAEIIILSLGLILQLIIVIYYFVDYGGFINIIGLCWKYIDLIGLNFYFQQKYQCCGYSEIWLCDPSYKPCYQYIYDDYKSLTKPLTIISVICLAFCVTGIICSIFAYKAVKGDRIEDGDEIDESEVPDESDNDVEENTVQTTRRRSSAYIERSDRTKQLESSRSLRKSESTVTKTKLEKSPSKVTKSQKSIHTRKPKIESRDYSENQYSESDTADDESVTDASDTTENSIPNSILIRNTQSTKNVRFSQANIEPSRPKRGRKTRRSSAITKINYSESEASRPSPKKRRRKTAGL